MRRPRLRKLVLAVLLATAASSGALALPGQGDTLTSFWAERPLSMDGDAEQWSPSAAADETSVDFRALNDSSNLYLLITPEGREGKGLLTGAYRQDATLWFLAPDRKARTWGLSIPYSRLDQLALGTTQAQTVEPEFLTTQGALVSTATLPGDISFHLERDSRTPMIEIRIALKNLSLMEGAPIPLNFTTSAVPPAVAEEIRNEKAAHTGSHGGRMVGGRQDARRRGGGHADSPGGQSKGTPGNPAQAATAPDPLDLKLSVMLSSAPQGTQGRNR